MAVKIKNSNGEWVIDQKAIQTSIVDLEGNFESENVEGALRELANKIKQLNGTELTAEVRYSGLDDEESSTNILHLYKILKRAIEKQMYSKEKLQQMLNIYYLVGQITEEEYLELVDLLAQEQF